jgi:murein DD-endopeptidase MepM/ murein hydrolase activator NlpD
MAKNRYHFNFSSLEIEKVKVTLKEKLLKLLSVLAAGLVFSAVVILIAYNFFNSPKEKMLKRENEQLTLQIEMFNKRLDKVTTVLSDLQNRDDNIYRVIFESDPIPTSIRKAGFGGADKYSKLEGYKSSDLLINTTKRLDIIARQLYIQSKSFDYIFDKAKKKNEMLLCIPAIQPISNKDLTHIASGFGYRIHPIYKTLKMHTGIDFAAPKGTLIYATGDGIVDGETGPKSGYGLAIVIDHGFGYQTLYGHCNSIIVKPGDRVKRGQIIGYVGSSGLSVGPHVHYEVIKNGVKIDPINFFYNDLTPAEYEKVLDIASRVNQSLS